jgi:hypothetical protein
VKNAALTFGGVLTGNVVLLGLPPSPGRTRTPSTPPRRSKTVYPFVSGDLIKLYLAAAFLPTAWRLVDRGCDG